MVAGRCLGRVRASGGASGHHCCPRAPPSRHLPGSSHSVRRYGHEVGASSTAVQPGACWARRPWGTWAGWDGREGTVARVTVRPDRARGDREAGDGRWSALDLASTARRTRALPDTSRILPGRIVAAGPCGESGADLFGPGAHLWVQLGGASQGGGQAVSRHRAVAKRSLVKRAAPP